MALRSCKSITNLKVQPRGGHSNPEAAYNGEIVGVIVFNRTHYSGTESMLNLKLTLQPSSRVLVESEDLSSSAAAAIIRQILVGRVLAWTTGIILLVSTILGVFFFDVHATHTRHSSLLECEARLSI